MAAIVRDYEEAENKIKSYRKEIASVNGKIESLVQRQADLIRNLYSTAIVPTIESRGYKVSNVVSDISDVFRADLGVSEFFEGYLDKLIGMPKHLIPHFTLDIQSTEDKGRALKMTFYLHRNDKAMEVRITPLAELKFGARTYGDDIEVNLESFEKSLVEVIEKYETKLYPAMKSISR